MDLLFAGVKAAYGVFKAYRGKLKEFGQLRDDAEELQDRVESIMGPVERLCDSKALDPEMEIALISCKKILDKINEYIGKVHKFCVSMQGKGNLKIVAEAVAGKMVETLPDGMKDVAGAMVGQLNGAPEAQFAGLADKLEKRVQNLTFAVSTQTLLNQGTAQKPVQQIMQPVVVAAPARSPHKASAVRPSPADAGPGTEEINVGIVPSQTGTTRANEADGTCAAEAGEDMPQDVGRGAITVGERLPQDVGRGAITVGEKVDADWNSWGAFYRGTVTEVNADGTFDVLYDDGVAEKGLPSKRVRRLPEIDFNIEPKTARHDDLVGPKQNQMWLEFAARMGNMIEEEYDDADGEALAYPVQKYRPWGICTWIIVLNRKPYLLYLHWLGAMKKCIGHAFLLPLPRPHQAFYQLKIHFLNFTYWAAHIQTCAEVWMAQDAEYRARVEGYFSFPVPSISAMQRNNSDYSDVPGQRFGGQPNVVCCCCPVGKWKEVTEFSFDTPDGPLTVDTTNILNSITVNGKVVGGA